MDVMTRFMSKCKTVDSGCIEWQGANNKHGYGTVWDNQKKRVVKAHRMSWELFRGPIPDGLCVLHHCDNTRCVNADHLFLGTQTDNMRDRAAKGRGNSAGEQNGRAVVTEKQVLEIRELAAHGNRLKDIAAMFGLSFVSVGWIVRGISWPHVGGPIRKNGRSHLTDDDVKAIRDADFSVYTQKDVADKFGISPCTVSQIVNRKKWRHVT